MSAARYDGASITISNWGRFNDRKDVKHPSWFRLDHDMVADPEFYELSDGEFRAWIYILSRASKKNAEGEFRAVYSHADRVCRVSATSLNGAIEKLSKLGILTVDGTRTVRERPNVPATDETNGRDETALPPLAEIWNQKRDPRLPGVKSMDRGGKRYRACLSRWERNPDPNYWAAVVERVNRSRFCLGENDRGWKADIEFLCRPDSAEKILEGKYDRGAKGSPINTTPIDLEAL